MNIFWGWALLFWMIFLVTFVSIGGYFMFRKFLKSMPKKDGMSTIDWQNYYIEQTLSLWTDESKAVLNELVLPVPPMFRDTAKRTIAGQIGELALQEKAKEIDPDMVLRGYIMATPKRDHKFLLTYLKEKNIDIALYQHLMQQ